jgi:CelD/BcsL family acetyltransferase involved in cellulose biosynthesis
MACVAAIKTITKPFWQGRSGLSGGSMLSALGVAAPARNSKQEGTAPEWVFLSGEPALACLTGPRAARAAIGATADGLSHPDCLAAAGRAVARTGGKVVVAQWRGDGMEWLLPLRLEGSMGITQGVPLAAPLSQYAPMPPAAISAGTFTALLKGLWREHRADLLILRRVRADNPLVETLSAIGVEAGQSSQAPFIDLSAFGSLEGFLTSYSNKTRRNRRRDLRRLEDCGAVEFDVLSGGEGAEALAAAFAWKRDWLRGNGVASPVFHDPAWLEALGDCARAPNAHISVLRVAGTPVAVELGFEHGRSYISYMGAFDPAFGRLSVGQEQMSRTIGWAFEKGFERYDLLPPDDDYKRHWTRGDTGVAVADYAVPLSSTGRAFSFAHRRLRPLARRLILSAPAGMRRLFTAR